MIDPRDRLLERSLVRLLGRESEAPDLAPRVLEAWQRGERVQPVRLNAGEESVDLVDDLQPAPARGKSLWPLKVGLAAALAAALGAGLWRAIPRTDGPSPAPAGPGGAPTIARGAGPWRASEPTELLAAFGSLRAMDGAVLTQDEERIRLGSGGIEVAALSADAAIDLPGGARLTLLKGGRARVDLRLDRPPPRGGAGVGTWWTGERDLAYGVLTIEVTDGVGGLAGLGAPRSLDGTARYFVGPAGLDEDVGQGAALAADLADLPAGKLPLPGRIERWQRAALDGPLMALVEQPALWLEADPTVRALLQRDAAPAALQDIVVDALARDRSPIAVRVLRDAWMDVPERFSSDAIVALADRGLPEFVREVQAVFRHWSVAGPAKGDVVPFALWLALRGKGDGALALAEALDYDSGEIEGRFRTGSAAVGLARLGDRGPWLRFRKREVVFLEKSLAAGDLEGATGTLAGLEYLTALLEGMALPLSEIPVRAAFAGVLAGRYAQVRVEGYASEDEVRAGLEAVLDR